MLLILPLKARLPSGSSWEGTRKTLPSFPICPSHDLTSNCNERTASFMRPIPCLISVLKQLAATLPFRMAFLRTPLPSRTCKTSVLCCSLVCSCLFGGFRLFLGSYQLSEVNLTQWMLYQPVTWLESKGNMVEFTLPMQMMRHGSFNSAGYAFGNGYRDRTCFAGLSY